MSNLFTIAGVVLVAAGLGVILAGLAGAVRGVFKRAAYRRKPLRVEGQGIWSGAVTAAEVYVPGTIGRKLGMALGGLLLAALGGPLLWVGSQLGSYERVEIPRPLATFRPQGERLVAEPANGAAVSGRSPGAIVVAHAEYIDFDASLERIGLGTYARVVHVSGYRSAADVLGRRPIAGFDVAPRTALFSLVQRFERRLPGWVTARRRFSEPMPEGRGEVVLWGTMEGLSWR